MFKKYHEVLMLLMERSRTISPLWQRGERIMNPLPVTAICDYTDRNVVVRRGDECRLLDNSDLIKWLIESAEGIQGTVPSVVFRLPPPDAHLVAYLQRLQVI